MRSVFTFDACNIFRNDERKMCGILAIIGDEDIDICSYEKLKELIIHRGPDYSSLLVERQSDCGLKLKLSATVLHLRGNELQKQPVIDEAGNILLFNGQVYEFLGKPLEKTQSDTLFLSIELGKCETRDEVARTLSSIDGPFAFVYWQERFSTLFYGRDLFGRKSLCTLGTNNNKLIALSSIGLKNGGNIPTEGSPLKWAEVDCSGIHTLDFTESKQNSPKRALYLWNTDDIFPKTTRCESPLRNIETEIYCDILSNPLAPLNCSLVQPLEICVDEVSVAIKELEKKLEQSISKRIVYNRGTCLRCRKLSSTDCDHSKISVAFSGGLDSTLIALFIDKVLSQGETIDLLTVAFKGDSPDRESVGTAFEELRKLRPNRTWRLVISDIDITTLEHARRNVIGDLISPCNTVVDDSLGCACWFIGRGCGRSLDSSIDDIKFKELFKNFLKYDLDPDENLFKECDGVLKSYTSPATMFFAGMGIDEQLGGYSSHRAAWLKSGCEGLIEEISFQMRRISYRNLGRDDRVLSDHGRDVKLPYLDFDFVSYLNCLPVGLKMNLEDARETGPKKLLRQLALKLGLEKTSKQAKRALQFGTRIAKLENGGTEKGSDLCQRLR